MLKFDKCFNRVIANEGGYQKDPTDRGNWTSGVVGRGQLKGTRYGISAMTYPDVDILNLTLEEAKKIYFEDWWIKFKMDRFSGSLSYQIFDSAINHGFYNATRMLQRALNVKPDGIIGPITLKASQDAEENDLLMLYLSERLVFMTHLKTWKINSKGWARRIAHNLIFATKDN